MTLYAIGSPIVNTKRVRLTRFGIWEMSREDLVSRGFGKAKAWTKSTIGGKFGLLDRQIFATAYLGHKVGQFLRGTVA
jgi:hypothetical protein